MCVRKICIVMVLATLATCFQTVDAAPLTGDALGKAIVDAKLVAPGYKVNAAIFNEAHEVVVSTYTNAASKDVTTDCKIDALLIARKVTEKLPQTVRVKVRFYALDQTGYREVVVTKPELLAFASGAAKKDEMLSSLEVVSVANAANAASTASAASGAPEPTARAAAGKTAPRQPYQLQPTDKLSVFRKSGLMFYYPKSWGAKDMSNQWGDFVELTNSHNCWQSVIFRLQDKDSALETAHDDDKYYWSSHQRVQVQAPRTVLIGYGKNIEALVVYIKDQSNPADPDRFEKHLYFGYKHRIYSISVRFCRSDLESMSTDLNTILSTIVRE